MIAKDFYIKAVTNKYEISQGLLFSRHRNKQISQIRTILWWAMKHGGYSHTEIGRMFKRDHSTIIQVLQKNWYLEGEGIDLHKQAVNEKILADLSENKQYFELKIVKIPDYSQNKIIEKQQFIKKL